MIQSSCVDCEMYDIRQGENLKLLLVLQQKSMLNKYIA